MYDTGINYLAILVAAISSMVIGYIWYGPLFGKTWMKLSGITPDPAKAKGGAMAKSYALMYIGSAVMAYVIAHLLLVTGTASTSEAIQVALWGWLGFIGPVSLGSVLWEGKPWSLWVLNNAYNIITGIVMALILFSWQ